MGYCTKISFSENIADMTANPYMRMLDYCFFNSDPKFIHEGCIKTQGIMPSR